MLFVFVKLPASLVLKLSLFIARKFHTSIAGMVICLLFYSYFLKQSTHSLLNYQLRNSENNYENVLGVIILSIFDA